MIKACEAESSLMSRIRNLRVPKRGEERRGEERIS
jgi:hypothetical protein